MDEVLAQRPVTLAEIEVADCAARAPVGQAEPASTAITLIPVHLYSLQSALGKSLSLRDFLG